jgi:hypothetical protein
MVINVYWRRLKSDGTYEAAGIHPHVAPYRPVCTAPNVQFSVKFQRLDEGTERPSAVPHASCEEEDTLQQEAITRNLKYSRAGCQEERFYPKDPSPSAALV